MDFTNEDDKYVFKQDNLFDEMGAEMRAIRRNGKLCDVILNVDGQLFSCHRVILAATIPYFQVIDNFI
jgi:kelch-like protein 18